MNDIKDHLESKKEFEKLKEEKFTEKAQKY